MVETGQKVPVFSIVGQQRLYQGEAVLVERLVGDVHGTGSEYWRVKYLDGTLEKRFVKPNGSHPFKNHLKEEKKKMGKESTKRKDLKDESFKESGKGAIEPKDDKKKAEVKKAEVKKETKKEKGPGVLSTILTSIKEKGPITREALLKVLVKDFPDREEVGMKKTIQAQLGGKQRPLRMEREKDIKFKISDKGYSV